jgi:hypothetical protein
MLLLLVLEIGGGGLFIRLLLLLLLPKGTSNYRNFHDERSSIMSQKAFCVTTKTTNKYTLGHIIILFFLMNDIQQLSYIITELAGGV